MRGHAEQKVAVTAMLFDFDGSLLSRHASE